MMIDWDNAPEGATHWRSSSIIHWYKKTGDEWMYYSPSMNCWTYSSEMDTIIDTFTPRPTEPTPYTRDEALQFLVDNLDEWPTVIDDAPLAGWGWVVMCNHILFVKNGSDEAIGKTSWLEAQGLSQSQQDPATAEQPAPDMVNHPPHYQSDNGIECIDAIRAALGHEGFVAYCIGNSMKYLWRNKVSKAEDLRKAAWYLNRASVEIEQHDHPQTER